MSLHRPTVASGRSENVFSISATEGGLCAKNGDCHGNLVCDGNLKECRNESTDLGFFDSHFCSEGGRLCQEGEGDCDGDDQCEGWQFNRYF